MDLAVTRLSDYDYWLDWLDCHVLSGRTPLSRLVVSLSTGDVFMNSSQH